MSDDTEDQTTTAARETGTDKRPAATRRAAVSALAMIVPVPAVSVLMMLFIFEGTTGKVIALLCKLWLVTFPLVWLIRVERQRPALARPSWRGLIAGAISGMVICAAMLGVYQLLKHGIDLESLRAKAQATGFAELWAYIGSLSTLSQSTHYWKNTSGDGSSSANLKWRSAKTIDGQATLRSSDRRRCSLCTMYSHWLPGSTGDSMRLRAWASSSARPCGHGSTCAIAASGPHTSATSLPTWRCSLWAIN